ncbi:unnamed protein product [Ostreobium quekettii]|uniref:Mitochondrial inner membrane translocase subunit Tim17/Tim22/Tim23/peroxisomal protein PMP24 n=1 Tax=Ostreobium quekettii TaxID=121088 RepID=A0A8S1J078_9CHLO|nr:unnamed protein product [Ostreobium quekettii]|eukprot:evm.model.scf_2290.3 EVM.evm.TU.scf_2290.3   scf_2290:8412-11810(+)
MGLLDSFRPSPPAAKESTSSDAGASSSELLSEEPDGLPHSGPGSIHRGGSQPRFYDPYEGLSAAIGSQPGVQFRLPEEPEFLFVDDARQRRRSWSENLCYYAGVGYLGGAIAGGAYGCTQLATKQSDVMIDSNRVKINRFLNMTGRAGKASGNAFGVLGLFFAASESLIGHYIEGYVPDAFATLAAGFTTGALYRSTRGPRSAAVAGTVGVVAAAALLAGRQVIRGL